MKYINAKILLPDVLVEELQNYIQGGYIYVPANPEHQKHWGEVSGYKEELNQRNSNIMQEYDEGFSMEHLAQKYCLSIYTIRKIIYQK